MYAYNEWQWILFFFCYCFFGWIFESSYVSLRKRHLVNRGFLRLPMLPLYGTGAVMMLFVSLPVKDNLVLVYFSGVIAATLLEYVTGWGMERLFKMRYWDYSNQRFQLHGYICLSSSIAWGFLTIFLTEVIHKPVERLVLGIHPVLAEVLVIVIGLAFAADVIESTRAALDLGRALEAMTRMKAEMEEVQVQIALLKSELREHLELKAAAVHEEAAQHVEEILVEATSRMSGVRESSAALAEYLEEKHQKARETAEKLLAAREELILMAKRRRQEGSCHSRLHSFYRRGILLGNPTAFSEKHREALRELREWVKEKGRLDGEEEEEFRF